MRCLKTDKRARKIECSQIQQHALNDFREETVRSSLSNSTIEKGGLHSLRSVSRFNSQSCWNGEDTQNCKNSKCQVVAPLHIIYPTSKKWSNKSGNCKAKSIQAPERSKRLCAKMIRLNCWRQRESRGIPRSIGQEEGNNHPGAVNVGKDEHTYGLQDSCYCQ